jgi:transcription elongation factor SPT5
MSDDLEFEHSVAKEELRELEDVQREEEDDEREQASAESANGGGMLDNDDEDEDDEDEDEDEEDDKVRSRKRARRDRNQFLDVEAEVSDDDDDEDEDDDDLTREGFIAGDNEHDNEPESRDDRLHRQMDRTREKNTEEDAQRLAATFKERYGRTKYRGEDSGQVSQRFLLPSINDPSIWAVRCRPGQEREIVKKLLKRKLTLEGKTNALKILSAFQRDNFTGYVYIEAEKLAAVDVAIKGMPDIYGNNKVLVPVEEFPDLLRPSKSTEIKLSPGSYVRIKRGKYKGDLAMVDALEENGLEVTLQIVPRIDYKGAELDDNGKRRRATSKFRPLQRLFSKKDALEFDPHSLIARSSNNFNFRGEEYIDGFLFKLFKLQHLETQIVQPTLEEISKFNTGDSEDLDLTSIAQSLKQSNAVVFNGGDSVQVLNGEQQGLQGDVISANNEVATVRPKDLPGTTLEFPLSNLRKIFTEGDHISVLKGKHAGHTGIVVSVNEDHVTFISDQSHKDVTVFANHLTKSDDSSTLVDGEYGLHDLVRVNASTVGTIIRADKDVFTVLAQDGKVLSLPPTSITSKIQTPRGSQFATDAQGEAINVDDTVREVGGFKRQGVVLHIFRSYVFVYSKETAENSGVFVTDNLSVSNVASKINISEKKEKLDLTKMNPKFRNAGQMAPPPLPNTRQSGRDRCLNENVSIRLGEYKGYRGIVKDTNGDIARVELHTKNKILSISKHKLAFVDKNNRLIPYEEFINQRPGFSASAPSFSTSGGNPAYQANTQSSAWSGSSFAGGKTPAWSGAGAGGATAYGSGTAWGGATTAQGSGTAWGGSGAGSGTAWGGNRSQWGAGANSSYGNSSSWGGARGGSSTYGASRGNTSAYSGGQSQWAGNTQHGGQSQWGGRSAYGQQGSWNAATPGAYRPAETPGAYRAETPYDTQTPYEGAPTPGYGQTAQTPGAFADDE